MKHSDLCNSVLLELSPFGLCWLNPTGQMKVQDANGERHIRFGKKGSPDILACIGGRFVGVECKVGRDTQSTDQRKFAEAISRAGGVAILARSVDDVINRLRMEGLL